MELPLSDRLRYWIGRSGISHASLAETVGVSPSAVSNWLSGASAPTLANLTSAVRALGVDLETFWAPLPEAEEAA